MPFAVFKNEANLDELALRLFSTDGKLSKTAAKQATAALLKANPDLEDLTRMPTGSLIVIPPGVPALVPSEAVHLEVSGMAASAAGVQALVQTLAAQLAGFDERALAAATALTELANTKSSAKDMQELSGHPDLLQLTQKTSALTGKDVEKALKTRDDAISSILQHLTSLSGTDRTKKRE